MTQTIQMSAPAVLSPFFTGRDGWVAVEEIMAHKTCESSILSHPDAQDQRRWGDWAAFLADLRDNGLRRPVMWCPPLRILGNGHHRTVAAYDLGWTHLPYVEWDGDDLYGRAWRLSTDVD